MWYKECIKPLWAPVTLNEKHTKHITGYVEHRVHASDGFPSTLGNRKRSVNSSVVFQYRWKEQWCAGHQGMRQKSQESERAGLLCQGDTHLIVWSQIPGVWDKWLRRWWWRWEVKNAQGEGRTRELIYRNGPDSERYKRQKWNYSPPLLSAYADTF